MAQFNMTAPQHVIDDIGRAARRKRISRCALVREAVAIYQQLSELRTEGAKLYVEREGKRIDIILVGITADAPTKAAQRSAVVKSEGAIR